MWTRASKGLGLSYFVVGFWTGRALPDRPGIFITQSTIHECPDVNIQGWVSPRLTQLILVGQYITIVLTFMISAETLNSVKTLSHLLLCNFRFYLHPKHPTGFKLLSVKIFNFCFYLLKCFTNIFEKGRKLTSDLYIGSRWLSLNPTDRSRKLCFKTLGPDH